MSRIVHGKRVARALASLPALAFVLALSACGGGGSSGSATAAGGPATGAPNATAGGAAPGTPGAAAGDAAGGGAAGDATASAVPAGASVSVSAFAEFQRTLNPDDTIEPIPIGAFRPPRDDTAEPVPLK